MINNCFDIECCCILSKTEVISDAFFTEKCESTEFMWLIWIFDFCYKQHPYALNYAYICSNTSTIPTIILKHATPTITLCHTHHYTQTYATSMIMLKVISSQLTMAYHDHIMTALHFNVGYDLNLRSEEAPAWSDKHSSAMKNLCLCWVADGTAWTLNKLKLDKTLP